MTDKEQAEKFAWDILLRTGYNYALSDVEDACKYLDHPELMIEDHHNFHRWAEPYERRCYCGAIGYTDDGRFYAVDISESYEKIMKQINPDYHNKYNEPYLGKEGK